MEKYIVAENVQLKPIKLENGDWAWVAISIEGKISFESNDITSEIEIETNSQFKEIDLIRGFDETKDKFKKLSNLFQSSNLIHIDKLTINLKDETVTYDGKKVEIEDKPYQFLRCLAIRQGTVVSRDLIIDEVWGSPEIIGVNTLVETLSELRQSIDIPFNCNTVEVFRHRGYVLDKITEN